VKFLQEKQLLSSEPVDVARLFHKDARLNRTAVGDYLGEGDE
jgi:brefeldin A-inhibited guanine nucleotide-exchange protein